MWELGPFLLGEDPMLKDDLPAPVPVPRFTFPAMSIPLDPPDFPEWSELPPDILAEV